MHIQGSSTNNHNHFPAQSELDACPICLDPFLQHRSRMVITACKHNYHETCLSQWTRGKDEITCPVCRQTPTPAFDETGNIIDDAELHQNSDNYLVNILKTKDVTALEEMLELDPDLVNRPIQIGTDQTTYPLLAIAASCSEPAIIEMLINANANVDQEDSQGRTPLMYAVINQQAQNVKLLLEKGAQINKQDNFSYTSCIFASFQGNLEILQMLEENGGDIHAITNDNANTLLYACQKGHLDVVEFLYQKGADIHITTEKAMLTALFVAIQSGNTELVDRLLEWGVLVNEAISLNRTPLLLAADQGHTDIVRSLIAADAKVNNASHDGTTPLYWAAYWGYEDIVIQLLAAGANKRKGFKPHFFYSTDTPAEAARRNNHFKIAELLDSY